LRSLCFYTKVYRSSPIYKASSLGHNPTNTLERIALPVITELTIGGPLPFPTAPLTRG
jgi:hypothetical protein